MPNEQLPSRDHDTLIRVESKVDQLVKEVKDLKEGTTTRIIALETRMDNMETVRDAYNPKDLVPKILEHDQWIHDYKLTQRLFLLAAGAGGGIIAFLINFLIKACSVSSIC